MFLLDNKTRRIRKRILKWRLVTASLIMLGVFIGFSYSIRNDQPATMFDAYTSEKQACIQPKLNPFEGDYTKHFHPVEPIKCSEDKDWISVSNGFVFVTPAAKQTHGSISCNLTYFDRIDDFKNKDLVSVILNDSAVMLIEHDFIKMNCTAKDGNKYENVHTGIRFVPEFHKKTVDIQSGLGLDVLMLGFDSLSHMTYIRKLKKTYKYFTENLHGNVLNGHNIVGDGTPQALIPILTGKTELELPRTLQRLDKKDFVDVYPMVWKDFQKRGYITAFAEDCPHIGTFTYRMVGFKDRPTNHYMRPFHITARAEYYNKHNKLCLGSRRRSELFMDWVKQFYVMYEKMPKFFFGFHSEVSHDDNNLVETADEDLYNLLKYLNEEGHLKNTLVILMSDHGARFSSLRSTLQGKQEERLPFFGFSFPEWFKLRHAKAFHNFNINLDRLTSPFDLHPTFLDILDFNGADIGDMKNRGISLFKEIPYTRTCAIANIEYHWCACLNWQGLDTGESVVHQASEYIVSKINQLTEPHRKLCANLYIKEILRAQKLIPARNLLKFKQTNDEDGFRPDLSDATVVGTTVYQIWVYTTPGNGLFELTVNYDVNKHAFDFDEDSLSRVNKYGDAPKCIEKEHEELRKYCYCYK